MKVSIVIVNYNHKNFPQLAIEALEKSKTNFPFEILVYDNHSYDQISLNFLKKADADKRITLFLSNRNIGFGKGNNQGAQFAKGKYLFIHNPDLEVREDTLQKMVDYLESHPDVGILAPQLRYEDGTIQPSCRRNMAFTDLIMNRLPIHRLPFMEKRIKHYLMQDIDHAKTQDVDLVTGAAMMLPMDVFRKVGGFDERYFLFMEDFDLCRMIIKMGLRIVYYPEAVAKHYHKRLSQGSFFKLFTQKVFWLHIHSAIKFFWKWSTIRKLLNGALNKAKSNHKPKV